MKKLQNNFTTPEQSKRLLELGVPADSADCYYDHFGYKNIRDCEFELASNFFDNSIQKYYDKYEGAIPRWSVGRLMEIMKICAKPKEQATMAEEMLYCNDLVELLVYMIEANKQVIDFSKLKNE